MITRRLMQVALVAMCLAAFAVPSSAQVFTGRIDVTAKDSTGAVLPGVTVALAGPQANNAVTDKDGEAHFLSLPPGTYTVTAKLQGFNDYKNNSVPVTAGSVISLDVRMTVGTVSEAVNVTAQTPVIEAKRQAVSTNVTLEQLQDIPTSRDPWVIAQTVPGVIVDRVNVGGAESGQQSNFQAKGAGTDQNTWNMDGINVSDMASGASSPTYYDFDMFQEMQFTTGGADVSVATPGVQLSFVLRSGTNAYRGSGRYYFENKGLQSDNLDASLVGKINSYNRTNKYFDTGFEAGGPIVKDRLFVWGAYGRTEPRLEINSYTGTSPKTYIVQKGDCTPTGQFTTVAAGTYGISARDCTVLENVSLKLTGDVNNSTRGSFTYFRGNKLKFGRGASATHPSETTENQKGPTNFYKGEISHTFGSALFMTARYAYTSGGFSLTPQGGLDTSPYVDDSGVWHGTYYDYNTVRPQHAIEYEGNYFTGSHEFKFGLGWRRASVDSAFIWPGGQYTFFDGYPYMGAVVTGDQVISGRGDYWGAYIGDTWTHNRLTVAYGVRWGRVADTILGTKRNANPLSPDLLPAITSTTVNNAISFSAVTPRVGVTYKLADKTILRASYAMFSDQLDSNYAAINFSSIPYYAYVYYYGVDTNGNNRLDRNEFQTFAGTYGFDPNNPTGGTPNRIRGYQTPKTHEFIVGLDHELMANFGVTGSFTYRRLTDFNWLHYRGVTGADYVQAGTLSGSNTAVGSYNVPFYTIPDAAAPADFGQDFEARKGYHQTFMGLELTATKRMSNRWMMRASFSSGTHKEYFDSAAAKFDPTPSPTYPNINGGTVLVQTSGSGKSSIYLATPKYQFVLTGAYQAKWGIDLGVNYLMRQGYAMPYFQSRVPGSGDILSGGANKSVLLVSNLDNYRLPAINSLDVRVSKVLNFNRMKMNLDLDIFNLGNIATTLGRQYDYRLSTFNNVLEIMNPRIVRLGVRIAFQ